MFIALNEDSNNEEEDDEDAELTRQLRAELDKDLGSGRRW